MDSAAIPFLPPQWWWWQQAASPLPPMVVAAGTLPHANLDPVLMTPQGACGGAQSAAVMHSTASCPPWQVASATSELTSNADEPPFSPKQQRDVVLKAHVASLYFKCFRYFRGILRLFHVDVAKANWNVAYVAIILLFPVFHLFFQTYVACVFI
jgi:hypothetical protein